VAPALAEAEGSELVGVSDTELERATRLAERFGAPESFKSFDAALSGSAADAVYLAVPVNLHVSMGIRALASGRHLLVEKPLALDAAQAGELIEASHRCDRVSCCAYYRRLTGQYESTRRLLAENEIGEIVGGGANYILRLNPKHVERGAWFLRKQIAGGGLLYHLVSHVFDAIAALLGPPQSVLACIGTRHEGIDVEDWASLILRLPNGSPFSFNLNWNSDSPCRHDFHVLGSRGSIEWPEWPPHGDRPVLLGKGGLTEEVAVRNCPRNWHLPLVEAFVRAVRDGSEPPCPLAEAARTNAIIEAAYRSAREGREAPVEYLEAHGPR
jgi:predicted dehydrogenase